MAGALEGKVALITGASSGIGAATALALSAAGASVGLVARDAAALEAIASEIRKRHGVVVSTTADVSDEALIHTAVEKVRDAFGHLDVLVNSAGAMLLGPIVGAKTEEWRRMMSINVLGLMYATHAALPGMLAQGSGHVVNVSSVAGRTVWAAGAGVYQASKFAVGGDGYGPAVP